MVTHEADIASFAKSRLHMMDGVVDRVEPNVVPLSDREAAEAEGPGA